MMSLDGMTMAVLLMLCLFTQKFVELLIYANRSIGYSQRVEIFPCSSLGLSDIERGTWDVLESTYLDVYCTRFLSISDGSERP
jgi:hypothetical protein